MSDQRVRLKYLAKEYRPSEDCFKSGFKCDYRIEDESEECPCQWAMKLKHEDDERTEE